MQLGCDELRPADEGRCQHAVMAKLSNMHSKTTAAAEVCSQLGLQQIKHIDAVLLSNDFDPTSLSGTILLCLTIGAICHRGG